VKHNIFECMLQKSTWRADFQNSLLSWTVCSLLVCFVLSQLLRNDSCHKCTYNYTYRGIVYFTILCYHPYLLLTSDLSSSFYHPYLVSQLTLPILLSLYLYLLHWLYCLQWYFNIVCVVSNNYFILFYCSLFSEHCNNLIVMPMFRQNIW